MLEYDWRYLDANEETRKIMKWYDNRIHCKLKSEKSEETKEKDNPKFKIDNPKSKRI